MMSYQLPDLLGLLTSVAGDEDDGDLHISPLYQPDSDMTTRLISSLTNTGALPSGKSRLERRSIEFTREYDPGLLASILVPFRSFPHQPDKLAKTVLQEAAEWVLVCALVAEDVLRPGRVVDCAAVLPKAMGGNGKLWEECETRIHDQRCSSELWRSMKDELLDALARVPPRPETSKSRDSPIQEYVKWRAKISGHKLLFDQYFSSSTERSRFTRTLGLVLEINACVTDLFAYNIHQAWYSKQTIDPQTPHSSTHLNIISFLMALDPEMTLQGAVNCTGEIIRKRIAELKVELDVLSRATKAPSTSLSSATMTSSLKSSLSSIVSLFPSFGSSSAQQTFSCSEEIPGSGSDVSELHGETRKVLLNWVMGTVHWAYEVEYFYPNVEGKTSPSGGAGESGKKRGSEVRDYGWVFLIKE